MYDFVIKNVRIIDGTSSPWFRGNVAVKNGIIKKVSSIDNFESEEVIDGEDKYLCPGFIDIHSHSDCSLPNNRFAESRILQGITTEIGGDCGMSVAPVNKDNLNLLKDYIGHLEYDWTSLKEYLDFVESNGISVNFGTAVGHGTIRIAAMGFENRSPNEQELEYMKYLLEKSLEEGAFSMSSGLIYPPGCYSDREEMIELCKVLNKYGAFYETHMRDEGLSVISSVEEALDVCKKSKTPLQIAHHKVIRKEGWTVSCKATIAMIEKARREGFDVTVDQYPYIASATTLDCNLPQWAFEGGLEKLILRLKDKTTRDKLRNEVNDSHKGRWQDITIGYVESEKNAWTVGKSIVEIAQIRGIDTADACFDLIVEEKGRVNEIYYGMCEEDVEYIMSQRFVMIGSDGYSYSLNYPGLPHPRSYGTFPRVLAKYCRDRKLFSLETAINKMTGMPAARLGIQDRGLIKEGMHADLVLFDLEKLNDTPTYANPKCACEGILRVYVNGVLTALNGNHTHQKAGKVLRKGQ